MTSPMRLDATLIEAAARVAGVYKRTVPKQIEFWAELGREVERVIGVEDVIAVTQGLKKITLTPLDSRAVDPDDVLEVLESKRSRGVLAAEVTQAAFYYEASQARPGFLDRVDRATGRRETGRFQNGEFMLVQ